MNNAHCPVCLSCPLVTHLHDGFDTWREELYLAGVSIPDVSTLVEIARIQDATGADALRAYINLSHRHGKRSF